MQIMLIKLTSQVFFLYRIPNELLKNGSSTFKHYFVQFLNRVMGEGSVPEELNIGKCVLIYKIYTGMLQSLDLAIITKGGDSQQPSQYRPITIPSNILRLITIRMCRKMTSIVEENGILGEEQFGFRRNRSTMDTCFVFNTLVQKAKKKG